MRHFNYYQNGGPFPGTCALCGITKELWDTAVEHARGGSFMICTGCVSELAENIGYAPRAPYEATIADKTSEINKLTELLDAVPNLTEGFINGVRSNLTDFVVAVSNSSIRNVESPVQDARGDNSADDKGDKPADVSAEAPVKPSSIKGSASVPAAYGSKRISATHK
jgi:hypothetical protein